MTRPGLDLAARLPWLFLILAVRIPAQLVVQEYPIPRAGAFPHDPAVGDDGMVWYTDQANSYIGRLDPATGVIVDWPTPTPGSGPHGITVAPDGFVWYTAQSTGRLGRVHPVTGAITEYVLPASANRPHTLVFHQGAIWFTANSNNTYGRFDPATGMTQVWPTSPATGPYGIVPAPDGSLWIACFGTNRLGRVDPATGVLQLVTLPSAAARPRRLAVSQDGIVWYTDYPRGVLGRFDPGSGSFQEWAAPDPPPGPYGIALGTDGRVWFHAAGSSIMIAFNPLSAGFATVPIPTAGAIVRHMVADLPRGNLWLALSGTGRIGRVQLVTPVTFFGASCPGSAGLPVFSAIGVPRIGTTVSFDVTGTAAPLGMLFAGLSTTTWNGLPLPLDLGPSGALGCFVNISPDFLVYAGPPGPVPIPLPVDPLLGGLVVHFQWALLGDPSGPPLVTTRGATATVMGI